VAALFLEAALQRARHRLGGEIVLRSEMTVEAAVRETGGVHDGVDADAVKAVLTKHPRSGFHDALAVLHRLLPAHPHLSLSLSSNITLDRLYDEYHVSI
jgi:hypothetical protein